MKNVSWILAIISLLTIVSCNSQNNNSNSSTQSNIKNVDATEFAELTSNNNIIILDVRTPQEIANGFIKGASFANVMESDFESKTAMMNKEATILVYCKSGGRSSKAAKILEDQGFNKIYNLNGGMGAWETQGMPIEQDPNLSFTSIEKPISSDSLSNIINQDSIVMVVFSTKWCAPCKKLSPELEKLQKSHSELNILKLDAEVNKTIAKSFNAPAVPTIIIFKNGQEINRHTGYLSSTELDEMI